MCLWSSQWIVNITRVKSIKKHIKYSWSMDIFPWHSSHIFLEKKAVLSIKKCGQIISVPKWISGWLTLYCSSFLNSVSEFLQGRVIVYIPCAYSSLVLLGGKSIYFTSPSYFCIFYMQRCYIQVPEMDIMTVKYGY